MQDLILIRRKLTNLIQYIQELTTLSGYSFDEYLDNQLIRRAVERLLQIIVESAAEINGHLAIGAGGKPPASYYESFIMLEQMKIMDKELAQKLASTAGLRNRLVHEYDALDDGVIFKNISLLLILYRQYIASIESCLDNP